VPHFRADRWWRRRVPWGDPKQHFQAVDDEEGEGCFVSVVERGTQRVLYVRNAQGPTRLSVQSERSRIDWPGRRWGALKPVHYEQQDPTSSLGRCKLSLKPTLESRRYVLSLKSRVQALLTRVELDSTCTAPPPLAATTSARNTLTCGKRPGFPSPAVDAAQGLTLVQLSAQVHS